MMTSLIMIKIRFVYFLKIMLIDHMLDYVLNDMILDLVTTALQLPSFLA